MAGPLGPAIRLKRIESRYTRATRVSLVSYIRQPSRFHWLSDHANSNTITTAEL